MVHESRLHVVASPAMPGRVRTELKSLLALASPLVLGQLAHAGVGFTDTVTVGRLGSLQLAGVALGSAVYFFLFIFCPGFLYSVGPSVSQAFGAGRHVSLLLAARQGRSEEHTSELQSRGHLVC